MKLINLKTKYKEEPRDPSEKPVIDTGIPSAVDGSPFFSVCIPSYNRKLMLPAAIDSVLSQDFTNFELIVCDNASTDSTEEVVRSYKDSRIRYVRYGTLVNMYANHNRCLDLARASWVVFLHSDDKLNSQALSQLAKRVSGPVSQDLQMIASLDQLPDYLQHLFSETDDSIQLSKDYGLLEFLLTQSGIPPSGCCFKKNDKSDLFDEWGTSTDVFTADRTHNLLTLLGNETILIVRHSLVSITLHNMSYSHFAAKKADWHIGFTRTMKLATEHPQWQEIQPRLAIKLSKIHKRSQLDFLIRLAQAGKWKIFYEMLPYVSKKCFLSGRTFHIIVPGFVGNTSYYIILHAFKKWIS